MSYDALRAVMIAIRQVMLLVSLAVMFCAMAQSDVAFGNDVCPFGQVMLLVTLANDVPSAMMFAHSGK